MRSRNAFKPCKLCKFRRRKCVRNRNNTRCDRCTSLQIECTLEDNDDDFDDELLMTQDGDLEVQNWQTDVDRLDSEMQQLATMKTSLQRVAAAQQESGMEWELCVTNGVMRLNTPIGTMDELLMFMQASIRYLSPFSGVFKREPLRFESTSINIAFGLAGMIQRQELLKPRGKRFATLEYDNINVNRLGPDDYRSIIKHLIPLYLRHCVHVMGLLHVPTFLKYYHSLDDPLNNAMVLAVCIDALVSLRHKLAYSPIKKRVLADTFYLKCKDLLFDLYDDPNRKLEVIFTTSFLRMYLSEVTLNSLDAGRLASLALLLCGDLKGSTSRMPTVYSVLLQRHCLYLETSTRLYQMTQEGKVEFTLPESMGEMEILDDEPEVTKTYITLFNHVIRLLGSRYITTIMGRLKSVYLGQPCEIPLEDILQFEPLVREWWSSLPNNFRLCDDPFDPKVYQLVRQKVVPERLLPFMVLQIITCCVCSSTLKPDLSPSPENTTTINVIQSVREKMISHALTSCKALVHALTVNLNPDTSDIPSLSFGVILYIHYCLEKIARCADIRFPQDLLDLLKEVVDMKLALLISAKHEVPPSCSILVTSLESSNVSPYDIYALYPFANDARMADLVRSSVGQLEEYLMSLHQ